MILASTRWTLADVLHNFDPFGRYEDFGYVASGDDRMAVHFSWDNETSFAGI